ncbi:MAG: hypothetical protein ACRCT7_03445, partial [Shewanella sp.]
IALETGVKKLHESFNLLKSLKPSTDKCYESQASILLDAYQAPLLVSAHTKEHYRLASGLLTYQKLLTLNTRDKPLTVPCMVLPNRPTKETLRLVLLNDIARPLLKQFVDVTGNTVTESLKTMFAPDNDSSVFKSNEWQSLFPMIRTKTELCDWLHVSYKMVTLK